MRKKIISVLSIILVGAMFLVGCGSKDKDSTDKNNNNSPQENNSNTPAASKETEKKPEDKNPIATVEMEDGSIIKLELYPEKAPNTVRNFISLANSGFYNGLTFHRIIPGFMIQGGDPQGTGMGGPDYSIAGEFTSNGFEINDIAHVRGVISMARSQNNDSAGSQFFIMHQDAPHLDNTYAAFGKVTEGIEVVDKIASVETGANDKPTTDVKMKSVSVETFGVKYNEPEKVK